MWEIAKVEALEIHSRDGFGRTMPLQWYCLWPRRALAITCLVSWQSKSLAATSEGRHTHASQADHVRRRIIKYFGDYKGTHTITVHDRRLKLKASESKSDLGAVNENGNRKNRLPPWKAADNLHIYEEERPLIKLQDGKARAHKAGGCFKLLQIEKHRHRQQRRCWRKQKTEKIQM